MHWGATLTGMLGLLLMCGSGRAQDAQPSEYQVKSAFIFNFAKFVEWPPKAFAEPSAPLCIGVLGENPFGRELEQFLRGKTLNSRPLTTVQFRTVREAKACHVLFVSASESKRLPEILRELGGTSVLTISETANFIESGGMINFFREGNKFRFQINDQAARDAGLKIASKLLELSRKPPS